MAKVVPNPEAAAAITECILDHPFNGEQQPPAYAAIAAAIPNNCLTLLFNI